MITATRSVAVVATRLPDTDRRALSQAWFSALHLAPAGAGESSRPRPASVAGPSPATHRLANGATSRAHGGAGQPARVPAGGRREPVVTGPAAAPDRRRADALARRIERALARKQTAPPQRCAAIAVKTADGRVHVLVQTDGSATRIVALCAPHLRERVDRALAAARYSLAMAGAPIEVAR